MPGGIGTRRHHRTPTLPLHISQRLYRWVVWGEQIVPRASFRLKAHFFAQASHSLLQCHCSHCCSGSVVMLWPNRPPPQDTHICQKHTKSSGNHLCIVMHTFAHILFSILKQPWQPFSIKWLPRLCTGSHDMATLLCCGAGESGDAVQIGAPPPFPTPMYNWCSCWRARLSLSSVTDCTHPLPLVQGLDFLCCLVFEWQICTFSSAFTAAMPHHALALPTCPVRRPYLQARVCPLACCIYQCLHEPIKDLMLCSLQVMWRAAHSPWLVELGHPTPTHTGRAFLGYGWGADLCPLVVTECESSTFCLRISHGHEKLPWHRRRGSNHGPLLRILHFSGSSGLAVPRTHGKALCSLLIQSLWNRGTLFWIVRIWLDFIPRDKYREIILYFCVLSFNYW